MSAVVVSDVTELRELISSRMTPAYRTKMLHTVPEWPTVKNRGQYLVELATGRQVLDIGCSGPISDAIAATAKQYRGVDRALCQGRAMDVVDLDCSPESLQVYPEVNLIICSEVLEHLANPGRFLQALQEKYTGVETCITVPNAGAYSVRDGYEIVNGDHVAWYSYTTLRVLLERYNYEILSAFWYNGQPHKAEGLIMLTKP